MKNWREWGRVALVILALLLIFVSILPIWWTDLWWVRLWDFPRLQVAGLLAIVGAGLWFVKLGRWFFSKRSRRGASLSEHTWAGWPRASMQRLRWYRPKSPRR